MATVSEVQSMAREKDQTKRNDVPVKVDAHVVQRGRIAAAYKGVSLAEYFSETLRPIIEADIEREHRKGTQPTPPKRKEPK